MAGDGGLAVAVTGALAAVGFVQAFVPIAIGLTTTALGTLLPILRDNQMLEGRFGAFIMAAGAVGEFLPIVAVAVFLSANGAFLGLISLIVVAVCTAVHFVPRLMRPRGSSRSSPRASTQPRRRHSAGRCSCSSRCSSSPRISGSTWCSAPFWPEWCCAAGRRGIPSALEAKLDAVGYGFFIPVFFVTSGMSLDLRSIIEAPARLIVFFVLFLVVRGLPALLFYRSQLPMRGRVQMMLLTATALPLLVALAEIGLESGTMLPENAAALVGAGVLSVVVFPALAVGLGRSADRPLVKPSA